MDQTPLDNPAYGALVGPHAHLAERCGNALRYPTDVSPFVGLPLHPSPDDWADLGRLAGRGGIVATAGVPADPPDGWRVLGVVEGVQFTGVRVAGVRDPAAIRLGPADVPEMLDLVARTQPGPFQRRTIELGDYLGIRRDGALVAMAGERLRPPGWTEISAVCTDAKFRGQGLGTRLTLAIVAAIRSRGDIPFLHATATNVTATRLYDSLGFDSRRTAPFVIMRAPG